MKSLKYITLIGVLCAGITSLAHATLTGPIPYNTGDSSQANELAGFIAVSGEQDASMCLVQVKDSTTYTLEGGGSFTLTVNVTDGQDTIDVSFDLTGTGHHICGFLIKDGNDNNVYYYTVSADEGVKGSFTGLLVPPNGDGGFGSLSHFDVFCCPGENVTTPDSGATAMLLGTALAGLGLVRRYLKH